MKHILLVDDYQTGRQMLREWLEIQGYACQEVGNGLEALEILESKDFDLVITDNKMPIMTGLELIQSLARKPPEQRTPIILLTGQLSLDLYNQAQQAGA